MELICGVIIHLEKKLKGIAFDLNMAKAMNAVLWFYAIAFMAACGGLLACGNYIQSSEVKFALFIIVCGLVGFIWITLPDVIDYNKAEIAKLKSEKLKCEAEIENYKQQIIDIREEEKELNMKPKLVLTVNQLRSLANYGEKAKNYFKWLIVTKDGEVVASNMKPEFDEQWDTWFFNNIAKTIQIGSNKKLAKHSKHTLTRIV